jgi:Ca2+-transporting ATPase
MIQEFVIILPSLASLHLNDGIHWVNLPSRKISFINNEITRNKFMWAALLLYIAIMALFYFVSPLNKTLGLQILSLNTWLIIAATSFAPVALIQLFKRVFKILD